MNNKNNNKKHSSARENKNIKTPSRSTKNAHQDGESTDYKNKSHNDGLFSGGSWNVMSSNIISVSQNALHHEELKLENNQKKSGQKTHQTSNVNTKKQKTTSSPKIVLHDNVEIQKNSKKDSKTRRS